MKHQSDLATDPVCGMQVDARKAAATREHEGATYVFCSPACAQKFDADPHRFAHAKPEAHHAH